MNTTTESFASLRKQCLLSGTLYEDSDFVLEKNSELITQIWEWKRPFEISSNPQYVCDGVTRFDVNQGYIGTCSFLAALANVALHEKLCQKVICVEDNYIGKRDDKQYAGICRFKFFENGTWKEVVIDDRLPVVDGKLIFATSNDQNEYWGCLVEKAFAKLRGSYGAINKGTFLDEAMKLLTGGVTERVKIAGNESKLFQKIDQTLKKEGLVGVEKYSSNDGGLIGGHSYSITHITKINNSVEIVRIRNPWGKNTESQSTGEWTGKWSDGHEIWNSVSSDIQKELELKLKRDGEFWFPVKEFPNHFEYICTCVVD